MWYKETLYIRPFHLSSINSLQMVTGYKKKRKTNPDDLGEEKAHCIRKGMRAHIREHQDRFGRGVPRLIS